MPARVSGQVTSGTAAINVSTGNYNATVESLVEGTTNLALKQKPENFSIGERHSSVNRIICAPLSISRK
ncbi:hypothetical protein N8198_05005 [Gammaproteobacteria bacterium]|nr:hypothetical protein [Gammaproteobacteria bacterium]